jgi:hypothetical protein
MTTVDTVMQIATLIREGKREEANVLLHELDMQVELICYSLGNDNGTYEEYLKHKDILLVKAVSDKIIPYYVTSENCYFLYKRSVQDVMKLVGVIDLLNGAVVFVEEFLTVQTEVPASITLYYPEFYITKTEKSVTPNDSSVYSDTNYREVEIDRTFGKREIVVKGEGKSRYTIGFTHEMDCKDVYLYEAS